MKIQTIHFLPASGEKNLNIPYGPSLEESIPLDHGLDLLLLFHKETEALYVGAANNFFVYYPQWQTEPAEGQIRDLVQAQIVGVPKTKVVTAKYHLPNSYDPVSTWQRATRSVEQIDCYLEGTSLEYYFHPQDPNRKPYIYADVRLTIAERIFQNEVRFRLPGIGKVSINRTNHYPVLDVDVAFADVKFSFKENFEGTFEDTDGFGQSRRGPSPLEVVTRHVSRSTIEEGPDVLWELFLTRWMKSPVPEEGLSLLYKQPAIAPTLERLQREAPVDWLFFRWLHDARTLSGQKNNQLLGAFLRKVGHDYDQTLKALQVCRATMKDRSLDWASFNKENPAYEARREACQSLPGGSEKIQEIEAKKDYRKAKGNANQAEGLGITADKYPRLRKAIEGGDIPIGVFSQPGKQGQPVNREFPLWERALSQKGWAEVIYQVAKNASGRSTYERDITPWLSALFKWPAFLDKHTHGRKKWRGIPKFVQSSWDLEMANEGNDENGKQKTQKERSAFTPWVDNDERTLTIPYVGVSISGARTQWCYSKHYHLFEEGFTDPESGGIVLKDFEEKLNGRDDYGLCYFTLTGTATARGYPTFLIIFERRKGGSETFVHFHRVRPCRSKAGVTTPACELVEACYQYMAGNIPAKEITDQQGDLIFLKYNGDPLAAKAKVAANPQSAPVMEFESHRFLSDNPDVPLSLHISTAKSAQNRLGFLHAPSGLTICHPEHEDIEHLVEGWYEIRRCKSYENNPVGIWSLSID